MLNRLTRLFRPEDPRRIAEMAFSRLITQCTLDSLQYREGLAETRRHSAAQTYAVGILAMERKIASSDAPDFDNPIPGVTIDFRHLGIGILLQRRLDSPTVIVAIPDNEEAWRMFECEVRHQSRRPGGWYQVGLKILAIYQPTDFEKIAIRTQFSPEPAQNIVSIERD